MFSSSLGSDVRRFNFTGNGSNTAFDLGFSPATQNQLIITINGVVQHYDAFSVSGSVVTFTGTPAAGDYIQVTAVVDAVGVAGIPDGAIANVSSLKVTTTPVLIGNAVGTFTGPLIQAASNANSWIQINAQNLNNGNNASTDMVLARSDGNDLAGYIDVGINSNTYSQAAYSIMQPNSGYMFTNGGDLVLGTQTAHNIIFHTGNTTSASERLRISANGTVIANATIASIVSPQTAIETTAVQFLDSSNAANYLGSIRSYNNSGYNQSLRFYSTNIGGAKTNEIKSLEIDGYGRTTIPNQPSFFAYKSNGGYTGSTQVIYNGVNHNVGNCYSISTGRFTAPIAGRYLFSAFTISSSSGGTGYWSIRKNGSAIAGADWSGPGYVNSCVTCVIDLAVNDYVDVQNVTGSMYGSNTSENCFTGHLLG